ALEAQRRQSADRALQIARMRGERHIGAVDAVFAQPIAMQSRRARMVDRPAEHAGDRALAAQGLNQQILAHAATTLCSRRMASTGSKGRPRMVKKSPVTFSNNCAPRPSS